MAGSSGTGGSHTPSHQDIVDAIQAQGLGPLGTEATLAAVLAALGPLGTEATLNAILAALGGIPPAVVQESGAAVVAGPGAAATSPWTGTPATWDTTMVVGVTDLTSVTVSAKAVIDGGVGLTAAQVLVTTSNGEQVALLNGETKTWSTLDSNNLAVPIEVEAVGVAYASIHYTGRA